MPATSGSTTQIATSVATKAALSNTPADQFQGGDLGFTQDELTAGRCPIYAFVATGGPVVDGALVLSVYQNTVARWVNLTLLAAGAATLTVPNLAALAALSTTGFKDSTDVSVLTLRSAGVFKLDRNSTATPDAITIVAAAGAGGGNWLRQENVGLSWTYQTTWNVDPVAGDDEGVGNVPGAALKTLAELSRRLTCVFQNSTYTVSVLADVPATDSFADKRRVVTGATTVAANGSTIAFVGQRTVGATFTTMAGTKVTNPATAVATAQAEVVRAAGVWAAADVGKLVVDAGGNTAWILTEKTAAADARVTDWISSTDAWAAAPVIGDTASVCTLTKWRAPVTIAGGTRVGGVVNQATFRNFEFDDAGNTARVMGLVGASVFLGTCKISNANGNSQGELFFFGNNSTGFAQFTGCMVQNIDANNSVVRHTSGAASALGLSVLWTFGNGARRVRLMLSGSFTRLNGMCFQGSSWVECGVTAHVLPGPTHRMSSTASGGWCGFYGDFGTVAVAQLACVSLSCGARLETEGSVYGTQVGTLAPGGVSGLASQNGGTGWLPRNMDAAVTPTRCFNIVPDGAGTEFHLDALATTTGSITLADAAAVLPIAIVCTTFAQYIGAVPNGWGRNMRNPANNGGWYQGL